MNTQKPNDQTLKLDLVNLSGLGRAIAPVVGGGTCGTESCGCASGGSCGSSSCGCGEA